MVDGWLVVRANITSEGMEYSCICYVTISTGTYIWIARLALTVTLKVWMLWCLCQKNTKLGSRITSRTASRSCSPSNLHPNLWSWFNCPIIRRPRSKRFWTPPLNTYIGGIIHLAWKASNYDVTGTKSRPRTYVSLCKITLQTWLQQRGQSFWGSNSKLESERSVVHLGLIRHIVRVELP